MKPHRSFAVGIDGSAEELSTEERLRLMGISPSASAAYDLLADDGMPPEKAAEMVAAAHRSGRDPEAFARHLTRLRKAWRAQEADPS
jgi:hypothetical protein